MDNFIYDITSYDAAVNSLSILLGISKSNIELFISKYDLRDKETFYTKLIEELNIDISKINISDLNIKLLHVTTNNDNCISLKKYGLLNTQEAIKKKTNLHNYINGKGIKVDFSSKSLTYEDNTYFRNMPNDKNIEICLTKLFSTYHYPINTFAYSDNPVSYGDGIHKKPEIIKDLAKAFNNDIVKDWVSTSKCYIIEIKTNIHNLQQTNFTDNEIEFEENEDLIIKEWLIKESLYLLYNLKFTGSNSNIYAYIKEEIISIEPENFIKIIEM